MAGAMVCPVWFHFLDLTSFAIELYSIASCCVEFSDFRAQ